MRKEREKHSMPESLPDPSDLSWFVGFYEGEGTASHNQMLIWQKDLEPLQKVKSIWGGVIREQKGYSTRWCWYASGDLARGIAKIIYPTLSKRRQLQLSRHMYETRSKHTREYIFPQTSFELPVEYTET